MAQLSNSQRKMFEKLFEMGGGYVLNFSNRTLQEFVFNSVGIDIYEEKYNYASGSKAHRIRAVWREESVDTVRKLLLDLLEYWRAMKLVNGTELATTERALYEECMGIAESLSEEDTMEIARSPFELPTNTPKIIEAPSRDAILKSTMLESNRLVEQDNPQQDVPSTLNLGSGNNTGDISVGNVAGRDNNLFSISLNLELERNKDRLLAVLDEVSKYINESTIANQRILTGLFRRNASIEAVYDEMNDLYRVQENRLKYEEWNVFLSFMLSDANWSNIKSYIARIVEILVQFRDVYYSRSADLEQKAAQLERVSHRIRSAQVANTFSFNPRKEDIVLLLQEQKILTNEISVFVEKYLEHLRTLAQDLGSQIGAIKARL